MLVQLIFIAIILHTGHCRPDDNLHPKPKAISHPFAESTDETSADYWNSNAKKKVEALAKQLTPRSEVKQTILFLGDGMSIPTLAATRVVLGNENKELSFEKFPVTGISKTYCVDYQVPDSACTATAYLGGVKTNMGTIGVTAAVPYKDCQAMTDQTKWVLSIADAAQKQGKSIGLVTTTRVTHASPAGVYAHTANRDWEADSDILYDGGDPAVCTDIATQLINGDTGKTLNVIMGGGRVKFLPKTIQDEDGEDGEREDNVNLIEKWKTDKGDKGQYITNRDQLLSLGDDVDSILGLFASSHLPANLDRDTTKVPSLEEMTMAAIKILSKNSNGFFLFVEGGLIDVNHHYTLPHKALDETIEFSKAIESATATLGDDALIVVTSDHSHTLSFGGYPLRATNIFELLPDKAADSLPYAKLNYAGGPGYTHEILHRHDLSKDDLSDKDYQFPVQFPVGSESHGADDVIIFAKGPYSHLFMGVMEQNVIAHSIAYAACLNDGENACNLPSSGYLMTGSWLFILASILFYLLF